MKVVTFPAAHVGTAAAAAESYTDRNPTKAIEVRFVDATTSEVKLGYRGYGAKYVEKEEQ